MLHYDKNMEMENTQRKHRETQRKTHRKHRENTNKKEI
jgi:hypothetical protein